MVEMFEMFEKKIFEMKVFEMFKMFEMLHNFSFEKYREANLGENFSKWRAPQDFVRVWWWESETSVEH